MDELIVREKLESLRRCEPLANMKSESDINALHLDQP